MVCNIISDFIDILTAVGFREELYYYSQRKDRSEKNLLFFRGTTFFL